MASTMPGVQPIPQRRESLGLRRHLVAAQPAGHAEADDARHVERAAAQAALVAAAVEHRLEADRRVAPADVQRADALGAVHLVGRQAHQVEAHRLDVERHLARGLGRVGVEQHAPPAADRADLGERVQRADLVVRRHQADEDGPVGDRRLDLLGGDPPVADRRAGRSTRKPSRSSRRTVSRTAWCSVAAVIRWSPRPVARPTPRRARLSLSVAPDVKTISRGVAPISAATSARAASTRLLGLPAEGVVPARGVAVLFAEPGQHGLDDARIDPRRGVVVHVDRRGHVNPPRRPDTGASSNIPRRGASAPTGSRTRSASVTDASISRMRRSTSAMAPRTGQTPPMPQPPVAVGPGSSRPGGTARRAGRAARPGRFRPPAGPARSRPASAAPAGDQPLAAQQLQDVGGEGALEAELLGDGAAQPPSGRWHRYDRTSRA